jgi:hypothetical protein
MNERTEALLVRSGARARPARAPAVHAAPREVIEDPVRKFRREREDARRAEVFAKTHEQAIAKKVAADKLDTLNAGYRKARTQPLAELIAKSVRKRIDGGEDAEIMEDKELCRRAGCTEEEIEAQVVKSIQDAIDAPALRVEIDTMLSRANAAGLVLAAGR